MRNLGVSFTVVGNQGLGCQAVMTRFDSHSNKILVRMCGVRTFMHARYGREKGWVPECEPQVVLLD